MAQALPYSSSDMAPVSLATFEQIHNLLTAVGKEADAQQVGIRIANLLKDRPLNEIRDLCNLSDLILIGIARQGLEVSDLHQQVLRIVGEFAIVDIASNMILGRGDLNKKVAEDVDREGLEREMTKRYGSDASVTLLEELRDGRHSYFAQLEKFVFKIFPHTAKVKDYKRRLRKIVDCCAVILDSSDGLKLIATISKAHLSSK